MAQTTRPDISKEASIHAEIEVDDPDLLIRLTGPGATHLATLEREFDISAGVRGHTIHMRGTREAVEGAQRALMELLSMLGKSKALAEHDVDRSIRTLRAHPEARLGEMMTDVVLATPRKTITAKGPTQHSYVQQMRENDIVFGIGPAGTGKTYLAMARLYLPR